MAPLTKDKESRNKDVFWLIFTFLQINTAPKITDGAIYLIDSTADGILLNKNAHGIIIAVRSKALSMVENLVIFLALEAMM
ncbi:hypothetical protein NL418_017840 [Escherichia coli]|nr:hypothetical protein [Escherichia coli]WCQ52253.1 hypothetical protein NL418_017840 [Escherichia coli]